MVATRFALTVALVLAVVVTHAAAQASQKLSFGSDGKFKIVQITDTHMGESDDKDDKTLAALKTVLENEDDIGVTVLTGDMVSGYAWDGKTKNWFESIWTKWSSVFAEMEIPYAYALGNHDGQGDLSRPDIVKLDMTNPVSLTQAAPASIGSGSDYVIPVYGTDGNVTMNLWMFDSGVENCLGVAGWGCVGPSTVQWYRETSAKITADNGGVPIPGLAFFHIPVPEFMNVWNNFAVNGSLEDSGVCCFSVNTGLFGAFLEMGDIFSVHCGHDHSNDYIGQYNGVNLAYGRKTGYGSYGPPEGWLRGGRVLEIDENDVKNYQTWIRQEDGSKVTQKEHKPDKDSREDVCCGALGVHTTNCAKYERYYRTSVLGQVVEEPSL